MLVKIKRANTFEEYAAEAHAENVLLFDKEKLCEIFYKEVIPALDESKGCLTVFGGFFGSLFRGLNSQSSDFDVCVFAKSDDYNLEQHCMYAEAEIDGRLMIFDIELHTVDKVFDEVRLYDAVPRKYPSVFYRSDEEKEKCALENLHKLARFHPDGATYEFSAFLLADRIFINRGQREEFAFQKLCHMVRTVDIMDVQYVRAYGNYQHALKNKETVLLRKYIYTLYELFLCRWIVERGTKPPMFFPNMLAKLGLSETELKMIQNILDINAAATEDKKKLSCPANPELNVFIRDQLEYLKEAIGNYPTDERYDALIERTAPQERQSILYF